MASLMMKIKKLPKKRRNYLLVVLSFITLVLIVGVQSTYAYYHEENSIPILAALVGDFDNGDGDINIMIYKQSESNTNLYTRTYGVPSIGYKFNESLTKCTVSTCSSSADSSCHYSYNADNKTFSLTSNEKVTCKFYFDEEVASDVNIYIMREDKNGTYRYNNKRYALNDAIPVVGYTHTASVCDNGGNIEYDEENHKFTVSTNSKDKCYAYFDADENGADITANIFVQAEKGKNTYNQVKTIPQSKVYTLNSEMSKCTLNGANEGSADGISYENGYINILAKGKQTCNIYLDIK